MNLESDHSKRHSKSRGRCASQLFPPEIKLSLKSHIRLGTLHLTDAIWQRISWSLAAALRAFSVVILPSAIHYSKDQLW